MKTDGEKKIKIALAIVVILVFPLMVIWYPALWQLFVFFMHPLGNAAQAFQSMLQRANGI